MTNRLTRTLLLVGVVLLAAGVAASGATGLAAGASDVTVEDSTVPPGETTTTDVTLEAAPDGLQRYNLTVAVADPAVATIESIEQGDVGGFQVRSQSETAVTVRAADLAEAVQPGANDVSLGRVTLAGSDPGTTELTVTIHEMHDDDARNHQPTVRDGTLTVAEDGAGVDGAEDGSDPGAPGDVLGGVLDSSIPWIAGGIALLSIVVLTTVVVRRRRRSDRL